MVGLRVRNGRKMKYTGGALQPVAAALFRLLYSTLLYSTVYCYAVLHSTALYPALSYSTLPSPVLP